MLEKLAHAIEMAFEIPDAEKQIATVASERLNGVINALTLAKEHLDIMYNPFKKYDNISAKALTERRGILYRYKQQVKKNYNKVKKMALLSIEKLNYFSTDTHILELINAFRDSIQDLEKDVSTLLETLDDYESPDFKNKIVANIEAIQQQSDQVEKMIHDRILDHLDANILTKNWLTDTSGELKMKIENRVPIITQLYQERQQAFQQSPQDSQGSSGAQLNKRPQSLNPGMSQGVQYPTDMRSALTEE